MIKEKVMRLPKWMVVIIGGLVVIGFLAVIHLAGAVFEVVPGLPGYGNQMIAELLAGIYAFFVLALFGYAGIVKEKGIGFTRSFYVGGFMVGYCMLVLVAQIYLQMMNTEREWQPVLNILMFVFTMFLIGWGEELIFRGILLNLFLERFSNTRKGVLGAVLLNGVLFGATHLTNIFSGVELKSVAIQAVNTAVLGIVFAAIYARNRNIWVVIIAHAVTDFAALFGSGFFGRGTAIDGINTMSYVNLIAGAMFLIPCVVLLRKSKLDEIVNRTDGMVIFETYEEADNIATTSLVLGVLGIITGFVGYGIGISIVGILGSCISKKIKPTQNGIATTALVLSIIGTVLGTFMALILSLFYGVLGDMFPELMNTL